MQINPNIINKSFIKKQNFEQNSPDILSSQNATNPIQAKEINLNNTPSVQNKVIVQSTPPYKEVQTFEVPNVGQGKMYQLKNGHKVVILPKQGTTNIYTHIKVGRWDEPERLKGISHLVEHLNAPEEFATAGVISNASTSRDFTNYYMQFAHDNNEELEEFIKIQSKIVSRSNFSDKDIERERNIVIAEISERSKNDSFINTLEHSLKNLFGSEDFNLDLGGDEESIRTITKQNLMDHYNKFYTPDNMVTTIVGDVNPDETIKIVSKYFNIPAKPKGKWESNTHPDWSHHLQSPNRVDLIAPLESTSQANKVNLDFIGPLASPKSVYTGHILSSILTNNGFTAIHKKLGYQAILENLTIDHKENAPMILSFETCFKEKDKTELKIIYKAFSDAVQNPIEDKDFAKAKHEIRRCLFDTEDSSRLADYLGEEVSRGGNPNTMMEDLEAIDSISKEDVEDFAKKYLDLNKVSVVMTHPKEKAEEISFGKANKTDMNYLKQYELDNNLTMVVDTSPGISKTTINLEFATSNRPSFIAGTDFFLSNMITGTGADTKYEEEGLKISYQGSNKGQEMIATIFCDADKAVLGIKQAQEVLFIPDFDKEAFDAGKRIIKEVLEESPKSAAQLKEDELFGNTEFQGMVKNIDKITLKDVKDLHEQLLSNSQVRVVITMPAKDFVKSKNEILTELSQGFPPLQKFKNIEPEKPKSLTQSYVLLDKSEEESAQAVIKQSYRAFSSKIAKDEVSKTLLRDLLELKIKNDLREKQGLVYSPIVNIYDGRLTIETETQAEQHPENVQKVIEGFQKNTAALMKKPVSKEELELVKKQYKIGFLRNNEQSSIRNQMLVNGLNTPYFLDSTNAILQAIDEVTPENIQRAAQLIFDNHSVISIKAPQKALEANNDYLKTKGEAIVIY